MQRSKVLIYRVASLGDTIVSLPALRLIARAFPQAERYVLTAFDRRAKASAMSSVLKNTGLVHGYLNYPVGTRNVREFWRLVKSIRGLSPDIVIYLTEPRGRLSIARDRAFFRLCGVPRVLGIPRVGETYSARPLGKDVYEYEGMRLLRCLEDIGRISLEDRDAFNLELTGQEFARADDILSSVLHENKLLVMSVGAKVEVKDWGDANWSELLTRLSNSLRDWALVAIGSGDEYERSDRLLNHWQGKGLNLCGRLDVRSSAAVLSHANLFLGHDSGPMHLASAVGTRCVAIFSSRNLPGQWFPFGHEHRVLYHRTPCQGCQLDVCDAYDKQCIRSITVDEVEGAVLSGIEDGSEDARSVSADDAVAPRGVIPCAE